jgi:tetratricopeptide (TPR) repeat protein
VTESLIQAVEARMGDPAQSGKKRAPSAKHAVADAEQLKYVQAAEAQGFVLTRYFYDQLLQFEKGPTGLQDAYPDWLYAINIDQARKHAENIQFAAKAAPEVVRASKAPESLLERAEKLLAKGDDAGAKQLAEQAIAEKQGDTGHAYFVLAKVASLNKDMAGARKNFEQSVQLSHEPVVLAWSHLYLGRIYDLQENREAALGEYRAALKVGDAAPGVKAAAERGIKQAYEPPTHEQQ